MMSVLEYALDIKRDVSLVISVCKKLGIDVDDENSMLDDEAIVILDNEFSSNEEELEEDDSEDEFEHDDFELDSEVMDEYEDIVDDVEIKKNKHKKKDISVQSNTKNDNFKQSKKEMYKKKEKLMENVADLNNVILYSNGMTVGKLADSLGVNVSDIIKKLFTLGIMMNINSSIDFDTASVIVGDYAKELKKEESADVTNFEEFEIVDDPKDLVPRPPVVTIMGHVDHGKTTLLDTIRKTSVAEGEAGGITQHIGAYQISYNDRLITFIDTPGHAAFTEMRARGAKVTDIVIIIVAADDGVMPQTKEAIDHAKAANVPIIVAVNKIDKPDANPDRVMTEMAQNGITPEAWGGDYMFVNISAKNGDGIDELLERILLLADINEYKANPNRYASGTVIETKVDKNMGVVSTILIQNGTLRLGDSIVVGTAHGRVRTLKNDLNEDMTFASPGAPVSITGLDDSPEAGDRFFVFENEKKARSVAEQRKNYLKEKGNTPSKSLSLDEIFSKINEGVKEINIVLKADVKGSEEAVKNSLLKINVEGVRINVIRSGIGTITESDIILAQASNAIVLGFNIRPNSKTLEFAKNKNVDIRLYNIIYKLVEEIEAAMKGVLDPVFEERVLGNAEVRKIFKFSKVGTIAGCYVVDGIIKRDAKARVIRDGVIIYDGNINSIAREKDQVKEVKQGLECGITIENFNDIKENDVIEAYVIEEIKR